MVVRLDKKEFQSTMSRHLYQSWKANAKVLTPRQAIEAASRILVVGMVVSKSVYSRLMAKHIWLEPDGEHPMGYRLYHRTQFGVKEFELLSPDRHDVKGEA